MTDLGGHSRPCPEPPHWPHDGENAEQASPAATDAPREADLQRFGAAAHLLDRLDTRPQALRLPGRPWWRFW